MYSSMHLLTNMLTVHSFTHLLLNWLIQSPTFSGTKAKQSAFESSIHSAVNFSPLILKGYCIGKIFGRYLEFILRYTVKVSKMKLYFSRTSRIRFWFGAMFAWCLKLLLVINKIQTLHDISPDVITISLL